jgi:hypothetical protein
VWSQVNIKNDSTNSQVIEIGNANTGEVVIDNGNDQQVVVSENPNTIPPALDTNLNTGLSANVDATGGAELQSGSSVSASTTSSGETNLSAGDVDANIGSDGSIGLSVGDINLKVK